MLSLDTFRFGGSPNKPRFCKKEDFDYIIDTNRIKLVDPQSWHDNIYP